MYEEKRLGLENDEFKMMGGIPDKITSKRHKSGKTYYLIGE